MSKANVIAAIILGLIVGLICVSLDYLAGGLLYQ